MRLQVQSISSNEVGIETQAPIPQTTVVNDDTRSAEILYSLLWLRIIRHSEKPIKLLPYSNARMFHDSLIASGYNCSRTKTIY